MNLTPTLKDADRSEVGDAECRDASLSAETQDDRANRRIPAHRSIRSGVIRRPDELAPVTLCKLDPGLESLLRVQEVPHAHEQPGLDGLAVPASLAVARVTAEMNSGEVGSVHIEQR